MTNYNKKELIDTVATNTEFSKKNVATIVENVFETITHFLEEGNSLAVHGFGKFEVKAVPARDGITMLGDNKGQPWHKDASKNIKFKAAKALKDAVSE